MTLRKILGITATFAFVAVLGSASIAQAGHTCTVTERGPFGANVCIVNCNAAAQTLIAKPGSCGAPVPFFGVPGEGCRCGFVAYGPVPGCVPVITVSDGAGNTVQCGECN